MIRPITCVAALLACATGYYVYDVSHQVNLLDQQIEQTLQQTSSIRERLRMLHAEWTVRNRPERLQRLADQYLALQPTRPDQFVAMADLAGRLPPVLPAPAPGPAVADGALPSDGASPADGTLSADGALPAKAAPDVGLIAAGAGVASAPAALPNAAGAAGGVAGRPAAAPTEPRATGRAVVAEIVPEHPPVAAVRLAAAPNAAAPSHDRPGFAHPPVRHVAPTRPRLLAASLRPPQRPGGWVPPRPAPVRLVAAGYRAPAYRPPPRPEAGGSLLGMAHTYAAEPAPMPMPYGAAAAGGGGG
jgi:hypothetical protein